MKISISDISLDVFLNLIKHNTMREKKLKEEETKGEIKKKSSNTFIL